MNQNLRSDIYGPMVFSSGIPSGLETLLIPQAIASSAQGPWGLVCLQELRTEQLLVRHFLFRLQKTLAFTFKENNEGVQSLLSLKGELEYRVDGFEPVRLREKEFTFLNAGEQETEATVPGGKTCSLFNTYYAAGAYAELLPLFPDFRRDLRKALHQPFHFLYAPKVARFTVHDAIEAIFQDRYVPALEKKYVALRVESTLFTLLAQTYTETPLEPASAPEREMAAAARDLILQDIRQHFTPEEIAAKLFCSAGWLKKAFSKVYGTGMFHFLRKTRMERAREMLLRGESLKAVALEVGMKPRNFPKEFKTFFGYTVTELKKGRG